MKLAQEEKTVQDTTPVSISLKKRKYVRKVTTLDKQSPKKKQIQKNKEQQIGSVEATSAPSNNSNTKSYVCPTCSMAFSKSQQLGGHLSKRHPNSSQSYIKKIQRRAERTDERELLETTKKFMKMLYPEVDFNDVRSRI